MREVERRLMERARRQYGLLTREQALAAGLSPSAWRRRIAGGALVQVHPRVVRLPGAPRGEPQRVLAAVLAAGDGAMASHVAATRQWGAPLELGPVDVTVADRGRSARMAGVRLHRPLVLADLRAVRRHGIPVTTPLRTIADLGAVAPEADVECALQHFLSARLLTLDVLHAVLARHSRQGRAGVGALRAVLARWELGGDVSDSTFEVVVAPLLAEHSLPAAQFHHVVAGYEVDFAFPEVRVAVEVDGWGSHGGRAAFETDRARDLALASRGWLVVRLTWWAVTNRPASCFAQLRGVYDHRAAEISVHRQPAAGCSCTEIPVAGARALGVTGAR